MVNYIPVYFYNLLVLTIMARKEMPSLNVVTLKKYGCHVMKYRSGVMRKTIYRLYCTFK